MVRVAYYDPGRMRDKFGMVGAVITRKEIQVLNAREWLKTNFIDAESDIAEINKKHKFDYHFCETNNHGWHVIDNIRRIHKIPIIGVNTGRGLVDATKIRKGTTMDKPKIVEWAEWAREKSILKMPRPPWSKGIVKLNQQLENFGMKFTGTKVVYEALEGNDDLAMCLFGICHVAKTRFLSLNGTSRKWMGQGAGDPIPDERTPHEKFFEVIQERMENMGMKDANVKEIKW